MNDKRLIILHVEDNADHAHLIARALQKHRPVDVRLVEDGEAALDYLLRQGAYRDPQTSPRPHLILLDLRLPKIDGLEVLQTIKTNEALLGIPVVVFTSSDADQDVARAYAVHANSYLVKPVGFDKFSETIALLNSYWLDWNRYPQPRA